MMKFIGNPPPESWGADVLPGIYGTLAIALLRRVERRGNMESLRNGPSARDLSNRALIREITEKVSILARKELELAKAEIRADLRAELATIKVLGVAAIAALIGVNLILVAPILALALVIPGWLAALLVGCALLVPPAT